MKLSSNNNNVKDCNQYQVKKVRKVIMHCKLILSCYEKVTLYKQSSLNVSYLTCSYFHLSETGFKLIEKLHGTSTPSEVLKLL